MLQFLDTLNTAQRQAVLHDPQTPLQILAGPGSGKTKVLTSRIAYLVLHHKIPPSSICAVTFTNKAANEMRARLAKLIGKQKTAEVRMGTFHAICALFLRKFSKVVGIEGNFTICDAEESKKVIAGLLKPYKELLSSRDITLKEGTVLSLISKAKSKSISAKDFIAEHSKPSTSSFDPEEEVQRIVGSIYREYEKSLRQSKSLDFDDLLLYGVRLFSEHSPATDWCRHVLVDEFQDTNVTQYELMRAIALPTNGCVTVVGDPDQSIYGWRSAEVGNLARMRKDFVSSQQILLEENYRSTAAILKASLAIVSQDKSRIQKTLLTYHPSGTVPVLRSFPTEQAEAEFIAVEIKRIVSSMGGVLRWGDFAILLRFSALSRAIESALQKEAIPSIVLGGHKFFERLEIKDLLAYLQLVDNPDFSPALTRAIGVPSRGIGEKSILALASRAELTKKSVLDVVELIYDANQPDVKPTVKNKIGSFVKTVRTLRRLANEGASPADLIRRLLDLIEYENHLKKTQPDWESRWENVQELITFASDVANDGSLVPPEGEVKDTLLRLFLQASMLSSEGDKQSEEDSKERVTISTCHAAKGLEWPVVIIPAVEQGTFPFYRTDDVPEERRLLYVACTRAQSLLYLSHAAKRKVGGETKAKEISEFVATATREHPGIFTARTSQFPHTERTVISKVLNRPEAKEAEVTRRMAEFHRVTRYEDTSERSELSWHPALAVAGVTRETNTNTFVASSTMASFSAPRAMSAGQVTGQVLAPVRQNMVGIPSHGPPAGALLKVEPDSSSESQTVSLAQPTGGVKRRLGMGRGTMGFPNKKFKPPIQKP